EIENLSFKGSLNFKNVNKINLHDINYVGILDISETNEKGDIIIENCEFSSFDEYSSFNLININNDMGKTIIKNSEFRISGGCKESIINYNGKKYSNSEFMIDNCIFDNKHLTNSIFVKGVKFSLESSKFYNGFSNLHGGFISVHESNSEVYNCTFSNGNTQSSGGVFNLINNEYFKASNIKIYNVTAYNGGGFYYEENDYEENVSIIENVEYINLWKAFPISGRGSIIELYSYSNLDLKNVYAEGFYCLLVCSLFSVNEGARLVLSYV
ncbi:hypothetical protein PIROE2DRAFT_12459, partial [Piromyces sp. E2]